MPNWEYIGGPNKYGMQVLRAPDGRTVEVPADVLAARNRGDAEAGRFIDPIVRTTGAGPAPVRPVESFHEPRMPTTPQRAPAKAPNWLYKGEQNGLAVFEDANDPSRTMAVPKEALSDDRFMRETMSGKAPARTPDQELSVRRGVPVQTTASGKMVLGPQSTSQRMLQQQPSGGGGGNALLEALLAQNIELSKQAAKGRKK